LTNFVKYGINKLVLGRAAFRQKNRRNTKTIKGNLRRKSNMSMIRWQPFSELVSLRDAMDRLFEDSFVTPSRLLRNAGAEMGVPLDMYQTDKDVIIKAALPGVKPEEVDISITDDVLTIKGETKAEEEVKREDYIHQEYRYGAFSRSVALPGNLKTDKAEASFEDGVLTQSIPKPEKAVPKQIKVKAKGQIEEKK